MADKAISELIAANQVMPGDLFILEQDGVAKKLTGQTLENWLLSFADGHGGIQNIEKVNTNGLKDTYKITLSDETFAEFVVMNGKGIKSIAKTKTVGLVDTYTITYNDSTTSAFNVTNGSKGDKGDNAYTHIKFASQEPTAASHSFGDVPDEWIGIYWGNSSTAPTDWTKYKWYHFKGPQGNTGDPATIRSIAVEYQASASGSVVPSGVWSASLPVVAPGAYLWTQTTITYNTGDPVVSYSAARQGTDGIGILGNASGSAIVLSDSANAPLQGLKLYGKTIQNGVPTPEVPAKLVSASDDGLMVTVSGKNLADPAEFEPRNTNCTLIDNGDGSFTALTASTGTNRAVTLGYFTLPAGVRFVMSFDLLSHTNSAGTALRCGFRSVATNSFITGNVQVTDAGRIVCSGIVSEPTKVYASLLITGSDSADAETVFANVQIEVGEAATDYAAYSGAVAAQLPYPLRGIPVTSGGNYTDASGQQWVCDEVDFAAGVYMQRVAVLNTEELSTCASSSNAAGEGTLWMVQLTTKNVGTYAGESGAALWSHRRQIPDLGMANIKLSNYIFKNTSAGVPTFYIALDSEVASSAAEALAALQEEASTILYQLKEPVTKFLSEEELAAYAALVTQYPHSTVINAGGADMELCYVMDTRLYMAAQRPETVVKPVSSAWEQRLLDRIGQFMIPAVALRNTAKCPSGYTYAGQAIQGVNYSSVGQADYGNGLVGCQVPLSTYYSALHNPASVMYTEDNYQGDSLRSTHYGVTCSSFVSFVCGFDSWLWTGKMASEFADKKLDVSTVDDLFQIRRGDLILNRTANDGTDAGHVKVVMDAVHDARTGRLTGFRVVESVAPFVRTVYLDLEAFLAQMYEAQPYHVVRLDDSDYGLDMQEISYSKSIYPDRGDGGTYTAGDTVQLYIPGHEATKITYTLNGTATTVALSALETVVVNNVMVYCLPLSKPGIYSICANAAADDPCTVIVEGS